MKKDEILQDLKEDVLEILFKKKDGSERLMFATLKESMLPTTEPLKEKTVVENDNVIRCFDVEIEEWRSFRVDSVIYYTKAQPHV